MGTNPEPDPKRAAKLQAVKERMQQDARTMVRFLGVHDTAGVVLAAVLDVLAVELGAELARVLLTRVLAGLEYRGMPPGAERN